MTHLALRLTARSEARNTQRHALRLTARSEAMTHLALRLTARSEARNTQRHALCLTARSEARNTQHHALRLTARSEAMTHLALRLTARSEARNKYIYSPFQGGSFRTIPSLSRKCSNFTRDRGLINTSTTCSSVLMYWSFKAPLCTMSRMK
jgi:hypothetical protein